MNRYSVTAIALIAVLGVAGCSGEKREENTPTATSDPNSWPDSVQTTPAPGGTPTQEVTKPAPESEPQVAETEAKPRETKEVTKPEKPVEFKQGVTAKIATTKAVEIKDVMPGEIAGPAVAITVEYSNGSQKPITLDSAIVSVNYAGQEASPINSAPAKAPPPSLAPGAKASGVYVFGIPKNQRKNVTIRVSYNPNAPQIVFKQAVG